MSLFLHTTKSPYRVVDTHESIMTRSKWLYRDFDFFRFVFCKVFPKVVPLTVKPYLYYSNRESHQSITYPKHIYLHIIFTTIIDYKNSSNKHPVWATRFVSYAQSSQECRRVMNPYNDGVKTSVPLSPTRSNLLKGVQSLGPGLENEDYWHSRTDRHDVVPLEKYFTWRRRTVVGCGLVPHFVFVKVIRVPKTPSQSLNLSCVISTEQGMSDPRVVPSELPTFTGSVDPTVRRLTTESYPTTDTTDNQPVVDLVYVLKRNTWNVQTIRGFTRRIYSSSVFETTENTGLEPSVSGSEGGLNVRSQKKVDIRSTKKSVTQPNPFLNSEIFRS